MKRTIRTGKAITTFCSYFPNLSFQFTVSQDDVSGINLANETISGYNDASINQMYAIGALLGLIGVVKIYQKWNAGDPDTGKVATA